MKGLFLKHTFSTEKKLDLLKMSKPSPYWYLDNGVMEEKELKQVCRQLAAGEKRITLKVREFLFSKSKKNGEKLKKKFWSVNDNWEVAEAGWKIKFQSAYKHSLEDDNYYLWIDSKGKN